MVFSFLATLLGGCPCPSSSNTFLGYRTEDIRLLLWLWRDLAEMGLPLRVALGGILLVAAKVVMKTAPRMSERWQRQTANVLVDWLMFLAGILFTGPIWIVANIVHNCLYYNMFESVWMWMLIVPIVAHGEGLIMYILPAGVPTNVTVWEKVRQIADLVWRMRQ